MIKRTAQVTVTVKACESCPFYHVPTFGMFAICQAIKIKRSTDGRVPDGFIADETTIPIWCPFLYRKKRAPQQT